MSVFSLNLNANPKNLRAKWEKHVLEFKKPAGTSRGVMHTKDCYLLNICDVAQPEYAGTGECSPLWGLSIDPQNNYENILQELCDNISDFPSYLNGKLQNYPSINFGLEQALKSLEHKGSKILFPSEFTDGNAHIKINGLVWMGDIDNMLQQIQQKIEQQFTCIKLKIGALNFKDELELIKQIRQSYNSSKLEIRVDANGAFKVDDALGKLEQLAQFNLHSIEQPIAAGQWKKMSDLCKKTPLPIALDEELIGCNQQNEMLDLIQPQYLILKPSLLGGFSKTEQWINCAHSKKIPWWITSALESNIGLNAIAQFAYLFKNELPQGLGTGALYKKNIGTPNHLKGEKFYF